VYSETIILEKVQSSNTHQIRHQLKVVFKRYLKILGTLLGPFAHNLFCEMQRILYSPSNRVNTGNTLHHFCEEFSGVCKTINLRRVVLDYRSHEVKFNFCRLPCIWLDSALSQKRINRFECIHL